MGGRRAVGVDGRHALRDMKNNATVPGGVVIDSFGMSPAESCVGVVT